MEARTFIEARTHILFEFSALSVHEMTTLEYKRDPIELKFIEVLFEFSQGLQLMLCVQWPCVLK